MNIEHLKTFREVVKLGSFSEVAKKLSITQPAVSFQIQKLEQQLGVRLIDRTQRAISLTAAGKRLLRFAESVENEREQLLNDLKEMRDEVSGDLLITASTIPGEYLLPPLLSEFKKLHPSVRVQVDVSDSLTVISGVRDNSYEVGFCGVLPEGQDLTALKIARDEIVLIVPPEHPLANKSEVMPSDIAGEALILRETTSGTQRNLERAMTAAGLDAGKWVPNLVLGTTQAVVSAVAAGAGIAFVSNLAIKQSLASGQVRQIGVRELQLSRDFYCIFREERIVTRLLDEFIGFIRIGASHNGNQDR
jgi:DNA-binding transcriptional LysR family regulator